MRKRAIYTAAVLAVACTVFFLGRSIVRAPEDLFWDTHEGSMYSFDSVDIIHASLAGSGTLHKRISIKGTLNFRVYSVSEYVIRAGFQFSPVEIKIEGKRSMSAEQLYSGLFFADMSRRGRFLNFSFSNNISVEDEKNISEVLRSMQTIIHKRLFPSWEEEASDRNGRYIARYESDRDTVTRKKLKYITVTDPDGSVSPGSSIAVKRSLLTVTYNSTMPWITGAEGGELLVYYSDGRPVLKTSSSLKMKIISFDPDKALAIWGGKKSPEDYISEWEKLPKNRVSLSRRTDREKLKMKYGDITIRQLISKLFLSHKKFNSMAVHELITYLEAWPESAEDIPGYLLSTRLTPEQGAMLIHALGRAGHSQAQKSLVTIMEGKDYRKENRIQSAMAFGDIIKPEEDSIKSLWSAYYTRDTESKADMDVAGTALLALGSITRKLSSTGLKTDMESARDIKDRIASDLNEVMDLKTKVALIHAAGNTGDTEFIEPLARYLESDSQTLRSTAVSSMTYMEDDRIDEMLGEVLMNDSSVNVRGAAVTSLYKREPGDDAVSAVLKKIRTEDNDIVRGQMYRYLLKNRDYPGVKDSLRKLRKKETAMSNIRMINRALHTRKKTE